MSDKKTEKEKDLLGGGWSNYKRKGSASEQIGSGDLLCDRINDFAKLEVNWDSYGARPIHLIAIEIAKVLAKRFPEFQAVPTPNGGVQLESHLAGCDVEIDISVSEN